MDRIAGKLEVFWAKSAEQIVVKHEDSRRSDDETGSIMLSPRQARHFASVLLMLAEEAEAETQETRAHVCARISDGPNSPRLR
jgi:hypothetical protein